MQNFKGRLLAGIVLPLALGGVIAGCGDDNKSGAPSNATTTAATTPRPVGDSKAVDQAFVRQMVPHHLMAVAMAEQAQERAEHNEIKDLATAIIAAQRKEITELRAIAKDLGVESDMPMGGGGMPHSTMADDAKTLGLTVDQMGMSMDMGAMGGADDYDLAFIDGMTPHHVGAIAMAKAQLAGGEHAELRQLSEAIISAQQKEIEDMAKWRAEWYPDAGTASQQDSGGHMGH